MGHQVDLHGKLPAALLALERFAQPVAPEAMGARLQVVQEHVGFFRASAALGTAQA